MEEKISKVIQIKKQIWWSSAPKARIETIVFYVNILLSNNTGLDTWRDEHAPLLDQRIIYGDR